MRKITFALCTAALFLSCGIAGAQGFGGGFGGWGGFRPEPVPEDLHTVVSGDVTMTINAAEGGKIISYKYKDTEVLSQIKFPNAYGSTFWTSPQVEWNWPPVAEIDRLPYEVSEDGNALILKGKESERLKCSVTKKFVVDPKDGAIVVTYSIINTSDQARKVAPWEITRVPGEGTVLFDSRVKDIAPQGLMPFVEKYKASWLSFDVKNENRKVNADGKGWLAYINNGVMMVKKFDDLAPGQPAPEEAEIQVYINMGSNYVELESQGAYSEIQPGASLEWTVRWYLVPVEGTAVPSKAILKKARTL